MKAIGPMVCIDSQTLVWGIRKIGDATQLKRAKWLFAKLEIEKAQIIVPTIVLSEYLTHIPHAQHAGVIASFDKRFLVMPFDTACVSLAAKLFEAGKASRQMAEPDCRKCLRADSLIIAIAKTKGAAILYSGDKGCRTLGETIMTVSDLPNQAPNLFTQ